MPGSAKDRKSLKSSIQQRQEQQRQGATVQFQPRAAESIESAPFVDFSTVPAPTPPSVAEILLGEWRAVPCEPVRDTTASQRLRSDPARPAFLTPAPAPSLPEVRARLDAELAHLPRQAIGPLTVDEEEALDLLHALIDRIPHAQLECRVELLAQAARAAVRAIREER